MNWALPVPEGRATYKKKYTKEATSLVSQGRALVLHEAPTKYKVAQMRRWIEQDNEGRAQTLGTKWLGRVNRKAGNLASSLPIYMKNKIDLNKELRIGKTFRTTEHDWGK